jgi:AraC-like DNA-binding protein
MTRRPNPHQPSCAAFWVRTVAEALESQRLDLQALFAEAGLELAALKDPDRRFASDKVDQLWRLALARSGNPTLGLASSKIAKPASLDVVAYTMMSAPSLLGILERLSRYIRIFNDAALVTVTEDAEGFRIALEIYAGRQPVPWQRFGFDLMTFLTFCRRVTARDLKPIALELTLAPSPDLMPYGEAFNCPLRFNAPANALLLSHADAMLPLPTAHRLLAEVHDAIADEQVRQAGPPPIGLRLRSLLTRNLPEGEPTRAAVAGAMAMSERTLHRRLEAEGTSFQKILDSVRRELAERYMDRKDLSLAEIAFMLGFGDQSSLFRASKRWFGTSPRQRRRPSLGQ